jgi:hypothetical protein
MICKKNIEKKLVKEGYLVDYYWIDSHQGTTLFFLEKKLFVSDSSNKFYNCAIHS